MPYISDRSRRLSIVYVSCHLAFSFMENSVLAIMQIFSFFLIFKSYKSSLKIAVSNSLYSVDNGDYLVVATFER